MDTKFKFNTPVLFLVFNRMGTVKQTFAEIKKAQPKELYISADGPRNQEEKIKTDAVRKYILDNIDWGCKVKKLFRDKNLGCKTAVCEAINWFFDNVEMGVVLEDDCVPSESFFRFCQELLEKYKEDKRVMHITGANFMGKIDIPESYFFYWGGGASGWASWRRAWEKYDFDMKSWPRVKKNDLSQLFPNGSFIDRLRGIKTYNAVYSGKMDAWDHQWGMTCFINNGLGIVPKVNLITNVGFNEEATHTSNYDAERFIIPRYKLKFPLRHCNHFVKNSQYYNFAIKLFKKGLFWRLVKRGFKADI